MDPQLMMTEPSVDLNNNNFSLPNDMISIEDLKRNQDNSSNTNNEAKFEFNDYLSKATNLNLNFDDNSIAMAAAAMAAAQPTQQQSQLDTTALTMLPQSSDILSNDNLDDDDENLIVPASSYINHSGNNGNSMMNSNFSSFSTVSNPDLVDLIALDPMSTAAAIGDTTGAAGMAAYGAGNVGLYDFVPPPPATLTMNDYTTAMDKSQQPQQYENDSFNATTDTSPLSALSTNGGSATDVDLKSLFSNYEMQLDEMTRNNSISSLTSSSTNGLMQTHPFSKTPMVDYAMTTPSQFQSLSPKSTTGNMDFNMIPKKSATPAATEGINPELAITPLKTSKTKKSLSTSSASSDGDKNQNNNNKRHSDSRLSLSELANVLHLGHDISETSKREQNILEIFKTDLGFELGKKTWVRDTSAQKRQQLVHDLTELVENKHHYGYDDKTIEVIIRRASYYTMQGRLRRERRFEQKMRGGSVGEEGDQVKVNRRNKRD